MPYRAKSLAEIAGLFEQNAEQARSAAKRARTVKESLMASREAVIWEQAANVLHNTTLGES